jgi:hypothetical protein
VGINDRPFSRMFVSRGLMLVLPIVYVVLLIFWIGMLMVFLLIWVGLSSVVGCYLVCRVW